MGGAKQRSGRRSPTIIEADPGLISTALMGEFAKQKAALPMHISISDMLLGVRSVVARLVRLLVLRLFDAADSRNRKMLKRRIYIGHVYNH